MAKVLNNTKIDFELVLGLNEEEARALDALTGYDVDSFLRVFYEKMSTHYMKPHEAGLRTLFASVRKIVPTYLTRVDAARKEFTK